MSIPNTAMDVHATPGDAVPSDHEPWYVIADPVDIHGTDWRRLTLTEDRWLGDPDPRPAFTEAVQNAWDELWYHAKRDPMATGLTSQHRQAHEYTLAHTATWLIRMGEVGAAAAVLEAAHAAVIRDEMDGRHSIEPNLLPDLPPAPAPAPPAPAPEPLLDVFERLVIAEPSDGRYSQVYVMVDRRSRVAKIGISRDPMRRYRGLLTGTGRNLDMALLFDDSMGEAADAERQLHERFAEYRTRGEWFRLTGRLAAWVHQLTSAAP